MSIYKSAVNRPITTFMVFAAVIIMGLYSLKKLPVDLYPEIEYPAITLMTTYAGASAADIETNVTKVLESGLNSVDKLKEITSVSYENLSVITLEFQWDADLNEATNDIRDALNWVTRTLPEACDQPMIFKFNTSICNHSNKF